MISKILSIQGNAQHNMTPQVTATGAVLTYSTSGVLSGVPVSISGTTYTFSPSETLRQVWGYIVQSVVNSSVTLMVDETLCNGVDLPVSFRSRTDLKLLEVAFYFQIPPNISVFDAIDVSIYSIAIRTRANQSAPASKEKAS